MGSLMAEIVKLSDGFETAVEAVVARLKAGKPVVIPTETVYGLVADAAQPDAVEQIYAVKQRDRGKPLQLLAGDISALEKLGIVLNAIEYRLAETFWPGALTLVLQLPGGGTEGVRVPDCLFAREVARRAGGVLRATSANASGEPPALTAQEAAEALGDRVELIVDGGTVSGGTASSVVSVGPDNEINILREGALCRAQLLAARS